LKHADNISQLKAISQNLMHSNISTTDRIYGILSENDMQQEIDSLNTDTKINDRYIFEELLEINKKLLKQIKESNQNKGFGN